MSWKFGVVAARIPNWVRISTSTGSFPVAVNPTDEWDAGDLVRYNPDTYDLEPCEDELADKMLVDVSHVSDEGTFVVNASSKWSVVVPEGLALERGDKVVVANGYKVVEKANEALSFGESLGIGKANEDLLTGIRFTAEQLADDVPAFAGYEEERLEAEGFVEKALNPSEIYNGTLVRPPRGLVILGPPGTGKTTLAKHLAVEAKATLYLLRGPEILSKWVGDSEQNLRRIFDDAAKEENRPSIIFIDELDSLAMSRDRATQGNSKQIVATLLSLMDGFRGMQQTAVIGTTNRIDDVDLAFRRAGRLDHEITLVAPNEIDRREILVALFGEKCPPIEQILKIVEATEGWTGSDLYGLARSTLDLATIDGRIYVTSADLLDAVHITQEHRSRRKAVAAGGAL